MVRSTGLGVLSLLLLLLPLAIGGFLGAREGEAGEPPLNWTYRDRVHKFSLKMFRDYKQVPLKVGVQGTICRFRNPNDRGGFLRLYDPEVEVVRIAGGLDPSEGPQDVWSATVGRFRREGVEPATLEKMRAGFVSIESRDGPPVPGKLWQLEIPMPAGRQAVHVTLAEFQKGGVSFGVFMSCDAALKERYAKAFAAIARSFRWFDKKEKAVASLPALEGLSLTAKRRLQIEKDMIKGWSALASPKRNYLILYNAKNGKNHLLARVLAQRVELIRAQLYEKQFPPTLPLESVCLVRVCKDRGEYFAYGAPAGSAGYWSPLDDEVVLYDASASKKADHNTLSMLYNLGFKHYLSRWLGSEAVHTWFSEGHADYYSGARLKGKSFRVGPFDWRVETVRRAIVQGPRSLTQTKDVRGNVHRAWGARGYTPLQHFVRFTRREYDAYPTVNFAQGWSLIYFLREVVPKNKRYEAMWGHILDTYRDTLKAELVRKPGAVALLPRPQGAGEEAMKALDEAFKDVDWDAFEAAWLKATARAK